MTSPFQSPKGGFKRQPKKPPPGRDTEEHVGYWHPYSHSTYVWQGCRCRKCSEAHRAYEQRRRKRSA